ncbi:MAG TPA: hypothetical protein PKC18_08420 [Lacipirellulaceae bacterium]|nr:hypothetical protein [Lacipirellulaceae bacterium]HMP07643.1 hypothetical protein [Lacipirellulaceae bacterium]
MPWKLVAAALAAIVMLSAARPARAGELVGSAGPTVEQIAWHDLFYVEFARQLADVNAQIVLAERHVGLLRRKVDSYRPMRSFGRYGATYLADQSAQLQLLAAEYDLQCLLRAKSDLWRRRQLMAHDASLASPRP